MKRRYGEAATFRLRFRHTKSAAEGTRDLLADNRLSELAETDVDKLRALLGELQAELAFPASPRPRLANCLAKAT